MRYLFQHPHRSRGALEVVIEELFQTDGQVTTVLTTRKVVSLTVILEHPSRLAKAPQAHEQLDALIPRNCTVVIVMHDEQRSIDLVRVEDRRIFNVKLEASFVPKSASYAALAVLVLADSAASGTPADAAVGAGHIAYRGACAAADKHISAGNKIRHLISAPALALDSHPVAVYELELVAHGLGAGTDAVICALARMSGLVNDIRYKDYISIADVVCVIDYGTARGRI